MRAALLIFAKVPAPGAVKTRLTALLSEADAARLYAAFLHDALADYARLPAAVRLHLAPSGGALAEGLVPPGVSVHEQRGDGLGERMLRAFVEAFVAGYERVVVVGTDHPTLPPAFIEQAFAELEAPLSTVIGPSDDGGYYLLGMNELLPQLFEGIAYSQPDVFARTLERAAAAGTHLAILPPWYDVDTPEALVRLAGELRGGAGPPHKTRELMAGLAAAYPALA